MNVTILSQSAKLNPVFNITVHTLKNHISEGRGREEGCAVLMSFKFLQG